MAEPTRYSWPHSMEEVALLIRNDGRIWDYWSSIDCLAICWAESGGDAFASPVVIKPGQPAHLSMDVGLMQMNTYWQRYMSLSEMLTPQTNISSAITLALNGSKLWKPNWSYWNAYNAGAHLKYIKDAREVINNVKLRFKEEPL